MSHTGTGRLAGAWRLFKQHWPVFVVAQLAIGAAWVVLEAAVVALHRAAPNASVYRGLWLALHLGFLWFSSGVAAGIHVMALQAVDGDTPAFRTAFRRFDRAGSYLLASAIYWPAVLAGVCLGILPGFALAARGTLFRFVLAEEPRRAWSSLRTANALSTSQRWTLVRLLALSAALNLAGAAVLGVGLLIAFPVTVILRAGHFRRLRPITNR